MKRSFCVVMLLFFSLAGFAGLPEDKPQKISIDVKQRPLQEILTMIEQQTGLSFSYDPSVLKDLPKITFKADKEDVQRCLDRLFKKLPVSYYMNGKYVILKKMPSMVTVSGFVKTRSGHEGLAGANVMERINRHGVATDENGFFSLSLPGGRTLLEVRYVGFQPFRETIPFLEKDTIITIYLEEAGFMNEVVVLGKKGFNDQVETPQMGALRVSQATIKGIPTLMSEPDIVKALQTLPGVSPGVEGFSGMYVRGGNNDENLYVIDNIPLYNVNHLGGVFSAFNAESIKDMDFYKSAFPARYGGRLSSVVDIRTLEGDRQEYHGSATIGLTSGNLNVRGPIIKDRSSFNISLRRTWLDVISAPANAIINKANKQYGEKVNMRYAFTDLNLKLDHQLNKDNELFFNVYWGDDMLRVINEDFSTDPSYHYLEKSKYKLRWGNTLLSSGLNRRINDKWSSVYQIFFSRYNSSLYYKNEYTNGLENDDDYYYQYKQADSENGISDIGAQVNYMYSPNQNHLFRMGGKYTYHAFRPEYMQTRSLDKSNTGIQLDTGEKLFAHEANVYIEDDWTLNSWIRLNAGLRYNLYKIDDKVYNSLDPRISARLLFNPQWSMKASYARMTQHVHQLAESYINLPTDMWLPVSSSLKPMVSDQVSLGAYYTPNSDYSFSIEGYYKWMDHLLDYKDGYSFLPSFLGWEQKLASGKGWAYGGEFIARKETGRLTGWIGYGLLWADRQFDEINKGRRFPAKYDNRHKLNIVGNYKLTKNLELTASWHLMSGNRVTLAFEDYLELPKESLTPDKFEQSWGWRAEYITERNNFRLPAYHRLDLGLSWYRPKKKGRMGIWNFSLYNAYCRMNPVMVKRDSKWIETGDIITDNGFIIPQGYSKPVFNTFGFIPVIPSFSYTYKF